MSKPGRGPRAMGGEKPKNFKKAMSTLFQRYLKRYTASLVFVFLLAILGTAFTVISPKILGVATDKIVEGVKVGNIPFDALFTILVFLSALYLASSLFIYVQQFIMAGIVQKITYQLRKSISDKLDRLPLKYFDSKTHGEIQSRVTNDIDTLSQSLSQGLTQSVTSVATLLGVILMMLMINPFMTLLCLLILPCSALLISRVVKKSQIHFRNQQKFLGQLNGHIEEMYSGHAIVKAYNGEDASIESFSEYNDMLYESAWKSQFLSGMMMPITNFIGNLGYVCICVSGGYLAVNGRVSIGEIQAFLQYVRQFNQPVSQIAQIVSVLQSTAAAAERVFELLAESEEIPETAEPIRISTEDCKGGVTFDHVKFGYSPEKVVIHDFSYDVKPGMRVAIVGPTGAGKTTLIKLLMRFYELDGGRILVDGVDIKDMKRDDLRYLFGMVLQDTWLFSGSIMENIRYGKPSAADEDVCKAAKAAQITHFINTLSQGFDTQVNEDASNISQGQKQLLTIARAILSDAPIMILDEATSSVDTRTETLIQKAMNNLMEGRTSFIIAHRLSTIRDADVILVIRDGDIVEYGNHQQLIEKNGFYAKLYYSQF